MTRFAFTHQEYTRRRSAVRRVMGARGIDVVAISSPANITYLSGYPACGSAYVPQFLLYDAVDDRFTFICRPMDSVGALALSILTDDDIQTYPEALVGTGSGQLETHIFAQIAKQFPGRTLGLEQGHVAASTVAAAEALVGHTKDASGLINWIRLIKSGEELTVHRQAAQISDLAMHAAVQTARPGVREGDVAAAIMHALCRGTDSFSGDWPGYPEIPTGARTRAPHTSWTDDVYRPGSQINCELGGWRFRYVSPLARTISIGPPGEELRRIHDATAAAADAILPMMRPGTVCADIWHRFETTVRQSGYRKLSRCGYSIGLEWDGGTASFQAGDSTVLQNDMTFHVMMGMWDNPEASCVLSETIIVSDRGAVPLSTIPRTILEGGQP